MSDIIPSSKCKILWGYDESGKVADVAVIHRDTPETEEHKQLYGSTGAICMNWDDGTDPELTPEGAFARLLDRGFSTREHRIKALREFAKIDNAEWARPVQGVTE